MSGVRVKFLAMLDVDLKMGVSSVDFLNVECRAIFSLSVGCRIQKLDMSGVGKTPLMGTSNVIIEILEIH